MLRFWGILLGSLAMNCVCFNNLFCAEYNQQQDNSTTIDQSNEEEDEGIVLLSCNSGSKSGKIIQTSTNFSEDEEQNSENESSQSEVKEVSCDKIMEQDFANMRIIQLANNIAADMGVITKVSLNR